MITITVEIENSWNDKKRAETPYFHCSPLNKNNK